MLSNINIIEYSKTVTLQKIIYFKENKKFKKTALIGNILKSVGFRLKKYEWLIKFFCYEHVSFTIV